MSTEKSGYALEISTAAYFQSQRFYVKRGVALTVSGNDEATDIDLLAIRLSLPLSEERVIVDCKDRTRSKPYERILWVSGLSKYTQANRAIVVLPNIRWQSREFASIGKVELIEKSEVKKYYDEHSGDIGYGAASIALSNAYQQNKKSCGERGRQYYQEMTRSHQYLIFGNEITNINKILLSINRLSKLKVESESEEWIRKYTVYESISIISVMLSRFCSKYKWSGEEWVVMFKRKLTIGDVDVKTTQRILKLISGSENIEIPNPPYIDEMVFFMNIMMNDYRMAANLPFYTDLYLYGFLGTSKNKINENPKYVSEFKDIQNTFNKLISVVALAAQIRIESVTKPYDLI